MNWTTNRRIFNNSKNTQRRVTGNDLRFIKKYFRSWRENSKWKKLHLNINSKNRLTTNVNFKRKRIKLKNKWKFKSKN